jgi:hypothetical protein
MCDSTDFMASGIGEWLHDGRLRSYPAGHRHYCGSGPGYSGTKSAVAIWTFVREGEVFGKEVVSSFGRIVMKLTISSGEKVFYSMISKKIY